MSRSGRHPWYLRSATGAKERVRLQAAFKVCAVDLRHILALACPVEGEAGQQCDQATRTGWNQRILKQLINQTGFSNRIGTTTGAFATGAGGAGDTTAGSGLLDIGAAGAEAAGGVATATGAVIAGVTTSVVFAALASLAGAADTTAAGSCAKLC